MKIKQITKVTALFRHTVQDKVFCTSGDFNNNLSPTEVLNQFWDWRKNITSSSRIDYVEVEVSCDNDTSYIRLFGSIEDYQEWYGEWFDSDGKPFDKEYFTPKKIVEIKKVEVDFSVQPNDSKVILDPYSGGCFPSALRDEEYNYKTYLSVDEKPILVTVLFTNDEEKTLEFKNIGDYENWYYSWFDDYDEPYDVEYID